MAKSFISFGRIKRQPQAWLSPKMEESGSERRKTFPVVHRSDEDIARLTSLPFDMPCLSSPNPRLRQEATCTSLSLILILNQCTLFFVLWLVPLPHLSPQTSPTALFPGSRLWSTPTICDLTLRNRARDYLFELQRAMCPEESHSSFCSPLAFTEFFAAAPICPLPLAQTKLPMPC